MQALCISGASSLHKNPRNLRPCSTLKPLLSPSFCCEDAMLQLHREDEKDNPSLMVSKSKHQSDKY